MGRSNDLVAYSRSTYTKKLTHRLSCVGKHEAISGVDPDLELYSTFLCIPSGFLQLETTRFALVDMHFPCSGATNLGSILFIYNLRTTLCIEQLVR